MVGSSMMIATVNILVFYAVWILYMLSFPLFILSILCILTKPKAALQKLQLVTTTIPFLLFSREKKWDTPVDDPGDTLTYVQKQNGGSSSSNNNNIESKTIYFVRHGESTWNDTFNKGDRPRFTYLLSFVPNLIRALLYEWYFLITGQSSESWFYDSPLSSKGISQARSLRDFMAKGRDDDDTLDKDSIQDLLATTTTTTSNHNHKKTPKSRLVSSNLRRAVVTMAVAFQDRLDAQNPDDDIWIMTDLQEVSSNPDALCITPSGAKTVVPSFVDAEITNTISSNSSSSVVPLDMNRVYERQLKTESRWFTGNKKLGDSGLVRLRRFCEAVFSKGDDNGGGFDGVDTVICAGHSFWFRSFFRTYLPYGVDHIAKRKKIVNGGVVKFTLTKVGGVGGAADRFVIDPASVEVVYAGF